MKEEDVASMRVADLKDELKKRGLAVSGLKAVLAERLIEAIKQENSEATEAKEKDAEEEEQQPKAPEDSGQPATAEDDASLQAPVPAAEDELPTVPAEAVSDKAASESMAEKNTPVDVKDVSEDVAVKDVSQEPEQDAPDAKAVDEPKADGVEEPAAQPSEAAKEGAAGAAQQEDKQDHEGDDLQEGSASPQPRHRELAAERAEVPAPVPVQDAAEEEVDYEADEVVDEVPTAPEEPAPHEARRPRAHSEAKSAAEGKGAAGRASKGQEDTGAGSSEPGGKTADKDGKRKRAPIPLFVPREKRGAPDANGDKSKGGDADASEHAVKLARTESNDKRSVFERLKSGSGKEDTPQTDQAADAPARRAPPSREAASRALLITGFIRPFTEKQARQKLSETGEITGFWMTKIKDRAYVVYATEEQAEATRHAVIGIEWPLGNGNSLRPKCVPVEDAEESIKTGVPQETHRPAAPAVGKPSAASAQAAAAAAAAAEPNIRAAAATPADGITKTKSLDARAILEERRRAREGRSERAPEPRAAPEALAPEPMEVEEEPKTLEDLFRKTTTKPWLYWLPLTDEQVAEKAKRDAATLPGPPSAKK